MDYESWQDEGQGYDDQQDWDDYGGDGRPSPAEIEYMYYYSEPRSLREKLQTRWHYLKNWLRYRFDRKYREWVDRIPF